MFRRAADQVQKAKFFRDIIKRHVIGNDVALESRRQRLAHGPIRVREERIRRRMYKNIRAQSPFRRRHARRARLAGRELLHVRGHLPV